MKLMELGINLDAAYGFSLPVPCQEDIATRVLPDLDLSMKSSVKKASPSLDNFLKVDESDGFVDCRLPDKP